MEHRVIVWSPSSRVRRYLLKLTGKVISLLLLSQENRGRRPRFSALRPPPAYRSATLRVRFAVPLQGEVPVRAVGVGCNEFAGHYHFCKILSERFFFEYAWHPRSLQLCPPGSASRGEEAAGLLIVPWRPSNMDIKQAITLIRQGQNQEAQALLKGLIRANPHDVTAWFWYAETLEAPDERLQLLNACLKQNPGNPQVIEALDMLRSRQPFHPEPLPRKAQSPGLIASDEPKALAYPPFSETISTAGTYLYEAEESSKRDEDSSPALPNIDISANKKLLAYLGKDATFYSMITPYQSILGYNSSPAIQDTVDYFLRTADNLPMEVKYLVYHCPALVHPRTGIIFCFVKGENRYYRLPENNIRQLLSRKVIGDDNIITGLGDDWVSDLMVSDSFIDKAFAYYGNGSSQNAPFPLVLKQDLFLAKSDVVGNAIFILYLLAFLIAIVLIVVGTAYIKGLLR